MYGLNLHDRKIVRRHVINDTSDLNLRAGLEFWNL